MWSYGHHSCLQNSMDRGAWWATIHGVIKTRTWLEQLSTRGHHWFCKQSHDVRDLRNTTYVWCGHRYMCWGLFVPAPAPQRSSKPSQEVLCSQKDDSYFQWFFSLHMPFWKARHISKDELSLQTDVWTCLLFKSRKTGLIILVLQKQNFLCCKNRENKMHWWSLNDPETKIIIVVINYITWRPVVVSQRSNPENSEGGKIWISGLITDIGPQWTLTSS